MATSDNLQSAFAGESQANQTYKASAKKADGEGHAQIGKLFRAAAAAEEVHAQAHLRVTGRVKRTQDNLHAAIDGEAEEFKQMYPGFVAEAEKEGNQAAVRSFKNAMAVEEIHHGLYGEALAALEAGKDLEAAPIFVCEVCGNTVLGEAPERCPICGAPKSKFTEIA